MREDWIECTLADIGHIFSGGTPKTSEASYWSDDIAWISPSDLSNYNEKYINKGKKSISKLGLQKSSAKLFPKNTVLFSSRAPIGYTVIANQEMCTNQGFKSVLPYGGISSDYLYYFLKNIKQEAEQVATGTTFKEISKTAFSKLIFPLSSVVEQKAIVNKIEELFSSLDSGIADLKKAQDQLVIYRQAVLKKAFEGELTATKMKMRNLDSLTLLITKGSSPKWQGFNYVSDKEELLFITSENVREGFVSLEKEKYLPIGFNKVQERSILRKGDVLFNIVGASIGRAAIFNIDKVSNINQAVALIRLNDDIINQYVNYFLNSGGAKEEYLKKQVEVARANLSLQNVKDIEIPFCSKEEQQQIVQEIESRLSVCDKVEESIKEGLLKAEALRQSILKKAFEGTLLSEEEIATCKADRDYEPASVLLEKIKAGNKN